jgi:zinc/manganese transport system permease protein
MELLHFLLAPFVIGLVLTGIYAYLGIHIVERGVIFVDLALAQVAALGTTIAFLAGFELHGGTAYIWSLGFTIIGAGLFTLTRTRRSRVPQEAIIGIVYAVSAAGAILAMSRAPEGAEHIKDMLVGNIVTVSWAEVGTIALVSALVGLFHYLFRRPFFLISLDPDRADTSGYSLHLYDFLFYLSFGVVVTISVAVAGVLLVFSYLIVPAVCAMLFAERIGPRLVIGWAMGTLVSAGGVAFSFLFDLPTGATIVCTFGAALIITSLIRVVIQSQ